MISLQQPEARADRRRWGGTERTGGPIRRVRESGESLGQLSTIRYVPVFLSYVPVFLSRFPLRYVPVFLSSRFPLLSTIRYVPVFLSRFPLPMSPFSSLCPRFPLLCPCFPPLGSLPSRDVLARSRPRLASAGPGPGDVGRGVSKICREPPFRGPGRSGRGVTSGRRTVSPGPGRAGPDGGVRRGVSKNRAFSPNTTARAGVLAGRSRRVPTDFRPRRAARRPPIHRTRSPGTSSSTPPGRSRPGHRSVDPVVLRACIVAAAASKGITSRRRCSPPQGRVFEPR